MKHKNKITFIGDSHSRIAKLNRLNLPQDSLKIHVGDVNLDGSFVYDTSDLNFDYFLRGNHDEPLLSSMDSNYIGDFGFKEDLNLFYLSGAHSPLHLRKYAPWYEDEELTYAQLEEAVDLYCQKKPKIMVSHDAPFGIPEKMGHSPLMDGSYERNRTANALEVMFEKHSPSVWIYGHHHFDKEQNINGTHFIALGELSFKTIKY